MIHFIYLYWLCKGSHLFLESFHLICVARFVFCFLRKPFVQLSNSINASGVPIFFFFFKALNLRPAVLQFTRRWCCFAFPVYIVERASPSKEKRIPPPPSLGAAAAERDRDRRRQRWAEMWQDWTDGRRKEEKKREGIRDSYVRERNPILSFFFFLSVCMLQLESGATTAT